MSDQNQTTKSTGVPTKDVGLKVQQIINTPDSEVTKIELTLENNTWTISTYITR